ncbi:hypothetical protein Pcinc_003113 [Petrolisthes cinctipes]|uniref:Uncharacterized protein n=1 Tax=Petrolisthes cinctipes TaxID=88211 RepID=A0AAE1GGY5_PETCI|nr:hypothetical protein Pcinc_003113 [Petrolisthes cinctipes]
MLVGWWLVVCLIFDTGFRSSLIAHLTVQGKSPTLDTFQDIVERDNWEWCTEPWLYRGAALEYYAKHTDPVVKKIYLGMQVMAADDALNRVLRGRFSLIDFENYITVIVASRYTDSRGNTPFYISNNGISVMATFGWGIRQGAPFFAPFSSLMHRLEDAGIINYWTQKIISKRVKENRGAADLQLVTTQQDQTQAYTKELALGLNHLQGAFYLLFLGSGVALLALLGENIIVAYCS